MKTSRALAVLAAASAAFLQGPGAQAIESFNPSDFSAFGDATVKALIQTIGIGGDHHAYMPATPLGMALGFDIGADLTYISFPSEFVSAMALATGKQVSEIPGGAPLPKLNIHKGLPYGIDIGGSFSAIPDGSRPGSNLFSSYGMDVKWAFVRGLAAPSVAARVSASYNNLYFVRTHSYSADLLISKKLILIDPYLGAGIQYWTGEIDIPASASGLPAGISAVQSGANPRFFGGLSLKLAIFRIVAEADYSTSGITSYGGKFSIGF